MVISFTQCMKSTTSLDLLYVFKTFSGERWPHFWFNLKFYDINLLLTSAWLISGRNRSDNELDKNKHYALWFLVSPYTQLDGVGTVDNRPSPAKLHHFVQKRKKKNKSDTRHLTHDTWYVTPDMWHVTFDMWHVTHGGGWKFSPNFSSLALTVWDLWCLEDWEEKDHSQT